MPQVMPVVMIRLVVGDVSDGVTGGSGSALYAPLPVMACSFLLSVRKPAKTTGN